LAIGPAATSVSGPHQISDADLLTASAQRDHRAFRALVDRYYATVYRVVWRITGGASQAEDITQEAFLKLWSNPSQIREAGALKGWLMRVASNLAMDGFRAKPMKDIEAASEVSDGRLDAEEAQMKSWATRRLDSAIARLPVRQRLALTLVHFEQMSNSAAAAVLEVSVDALESLLARARRALKEELAADRQSLLEAVNVEGQIS
jgi:RNA polymerase sigma-70 factor (ECF subfamily)